MNHLSRILVAVDFSDPARAAFDHALALCHGRGAELTVVHAIPANQTMRHHDRERVALMGTLRQAAAAAGIRLQVSVQQGDPAGLILLYAHSRRPDVIVLGTHQRTGLERFRVRSVAEHVTLRAMRPVLIVPGAKDAASTPPASCFDRILAAVDFGVASERAVDAALSLSDHANTGLMFVHVVLGTPYQKVVRYLHRLGGGEYHRVPADDAWHRLQDMIRHGASSRSQPHARVVTGDPPRAIARVASEWDADLIVIGVTRGHVVRRGIFGSTASRVLRLARCPVLAVPELVLERTDLSPDAVVKRRDLSSRQLSKPEGHSSMDVNPRPVACPHCRHGAPAAGAA